MPDTTRASVPASAPAPVNTAAAQLDFLKAIVAAAESHLRAFDTKAQIALAAFVLSWNPLLAMVNATCRQGLAVVPVTLLAGVVVLTVLCYGRAVWPLSARTIGSTPSLFFLTSPSATVPALVDRLASASYVETLAEEALKLAGLRVQKTRRLKVALVATVLAYGLYLALLLSGRQCA